MPKRSIVVRVMSMIENATSIRVEKLPKYPERRNAKRIEVSSMRPTAQAWQMCQSSARFEWVRFGSYRWNAQ